MLLIYIEKCNDRLKYVLDFVFKLRNIEYKIINSISEFEQKPSEKISLQNWQFSPLLREEGITKCLVEKSVWKGRACLSFDGISDPFAAIFYVLTRMEEYDCQNLDSHGRFFGKSSIQFQNNWLTKCICDRWAIGILEEFEKEFQLNLLIKTKKVITIPTFDIDNTFAYLLKKGKRKYLSISKDLVLFRVKRLVERQRVLARKRKDPYDTFDCIRSISEKFAVRIFWLVADYGGLDNNITQNSQAHQNLLKKMNSVAKVGIHPSYASNTNTELLKSEVQILQNSLQNPVEISRQHFLKLKFPETYKNLILAQIKEDFSMGFSDQIGFRNGTAHAFPWFDLEKNEITNLIIRPFAYMDGTLNEYLKLSPDQAKMEIKKLYEEVTQSGGDFIFLWHNETIGEYGKWKGWKTVLDYTLSLSKEKQS